ncbi:MULTISPECIES: hypothetical protein [unclassified Rathayibacter]|uniref:hypothetical protein n=1 Tax=unclassified Rathayibacter TaxID=2609250 RepID=UPI0011B01EE2|nr:MULTISPECIES: hypothetical protein [unclassified Rathayibacter]
MSLFIPREVYQLLSAVAAPATIGLICFVLSWAYPRRIISLPASGRRASTLTWAGVAGALLVIVVAVVVHVSTPADTTGFEGWWRRPAPLLVAALVVTVAMLLVRREPLPAPGETAVAPQRRWHEFASRPLLWIGAVTTALLALTSIWQTVIATTAPEDAFFLGNVPEHTTLPIYMPFNANYGYIAGVGWPNYLATLITLALAVAALVLALRTDANRPLRARSTATSVRPERELTARLFTLLLLGGLITTLGAVWMHAGDIGTIIVGVDGQSTASGNLVYVGSAYRAFAQPLLYAGFLGQGIGVALLLRVATDTLRSAAALRRARMPLIETLPFDGVAR